MKRIEGGYIYSDINEMLKNLTHLLKRLNILWLDGSRVNNDTHYGGDYDIRGNILTARNTEARFTKTNKITDISSDDKYFSLVNNRNSLDFTVSTEIHGIWNSKDFEHLLKRFFSNRTSDITTNLPIENFLGPILKVLEIPNSTPVGDVSFNLSRLCNQIIEQATNFDSLYNSVIVNYKFSPNRIDVVVDFYTKLRSGDSEENVLLALRRVLGFAQKKENDSLIQKTEISEKNPQAFESLIETLTKNRIAEEGDALRNLTWKNNANYKNKLKSLSGDLTVKPAIIKNDPFDAFVNERKVFQFAFDPKVSTIYYNPMILEYLPQVKKMNYYGLFEDDKFFEINILSSFLIGIINHEIGHFKYHSKDEAIANREMASRYGFLDFAACVFVTAIQENRISSKLKKIKPEIKKNIQFRIEFRIEKEHNSNPSIIVPEYYLNKDVVLNITNNFLDDFSDLRNKNNFYNPLRQNPVPIMPNRGYFAI